MGDHVRIFDTTLRDGEQSPGCTMTRDEKLEVARQLARLKVDIIEAGFPVASPGDWEAVNAIAREIGTPDGPTICGLARAHRGDIEAAWTAVQPAAKSRIHVFISTSDIHIEHQLRSTREEVLERAREMVAYARSLCPDVEFSPMDAGRSEPAYMHKVLEAAIEAGATTLNIPDTVGYLTPAEYGEMILNIRKKVRGADQVTISTHCHDDLGMAVANSLAGVHAGARQVECTINGIGERAGNASLEEVVMAIHTRRDFFGLTTQIETTQLAHSSRLLSACIGMPVPPNKAVVGDNAFAHESGIHQDGVLKERSTYEIMDARSVGLEANSIVLGKHSGRHALQSALAELGYPVSGQALAGAFKRFKEVADRKKQVTAMDLEALVAEELREETRAYALEWFEVTASSRRPPHARVGVRTPDGALVEGDFTGDGPIDAVFRAIASATGRAARMREFRIDSVTGGPDALGEASVVLEANGVSAGGQGVSTDIVEAAALAYVRALSGVERRARIKPEAAAPELAPTP